MSGNMSIKLEGPVSSGHSSVLEGANVMSTTSDRVFVPLSSPVLLGAEKWM